MPVAFRKNRDGSYSSTDQKFTIVKNRNKWLLTDTRAPTISTPFLTLGSAKTEAQRREAAGGFVKNIRLVGELTCHECGQTSNGVQFQLAAELSSELGYYDEVDISGVANIDGHCPNCDNPVRKSISFGEYYGLNI